MRVASLETTSQGHPASLQLLHSLLLLAAVGAGGLAVLIVGAMIGYGAPPWALVVPALVLAASLGAAWLVRRQLARPAGG
jgi:hypothetical protein